jgi:hypothetical protein
MPNENEGAKEARRTIKRFQEHINSPRLVPNQCYRMSSGTYQLVSYANQVTGLYLSKNYSVIPIFLQRAHEQLRKENPERVSEPYRELVFHYLSHVAHFVVEYDCLGDDEGHLVQFIPRELLDIVPSALPEELVVPGEF